MNVFITHPVSNVYGQMEFEYNRNPSFDDASRIIASCIRDNAPLRIKVNGDPVLIGSEYLNQSKIEFAE
jgi:hypothetical protein